MAAEIFFDRKDRGRVRPRDVVRARSSSLGNAKLCGALGRMTVLEFRNLFEVMYLLTYLLGRERGLE
jgi:hypothetical protein